MGDDKVIDDDLLLEIAKAAEVYDIGVFEVDRDRLSVLEMSYELCKKAFPNSDVKLYKHEPFQIAGHIEIIDNVIKCEDTKAFSLVAAAATSLESIAYVNGNVGLDITFYGIAKKVRF